jgi:hypothetical protein
LSWFDVAETADGRSYSVSTRPTGLTALRASGAARIPLGWLDYLAPNVMIGWLVNRLIFRGQWTVLIAPWYGHRGQRWSVRVPDEDQADRRARALHELIHTHQWDPESEPPPEPAP